MIQSSCLVKTRGEQISRIGFPTNGWHVTTVPSTVVAALVADKTYPDPYLGTNLLSIPGMTHPVGENFSLLPMPKNSPFRCSWWYRTEFQLPKNFSGRHAWLHFDGINNRANVWMNGRRIEESGKVAGAYRTYEVDVSEMRQARHGERAGGRSLRTNAKRPGNQLGGLDSRATGQRSGAVAEGLPERERSGDHSLSARGDAPCGERDR